MDFEASTSANARVSGENLRGVTNKLMEQDHLIKIKIF